MCTDSGGTEYTKETRSAITPPSGRRSAYSLTPQTDGSLAGLFAWDATHPVTTTLEPGASVQQCKFVFTAVRGTSDGQAVGLSELRLYDAYGDMLDVISSATNPGGTAVNSRSPSTLFDKSTSTRWQDTMGVPSTLLLTLSQSSAVLGYDFFSSSDFFGHDPKTWQVSCRNGTSGAWATMHTKTDVTSPSARRASYVIGANPNGQATYAWPASTSSFPSFASALPTAVFAADAALARSCKFVIWAVSGIGDGEQAHGHPRSHPPLVCPFSCDSCHLGHCD